MEIRIPTGTRDLVGEDVLRKRWLQNRIMSVFDRYCFEEVMTPAFEFYQTYNAAFDNLEDREMVKFFDENGDILALRVDMTVPITRLAATRYTQKDLPLRFCYSSNVYKVKKAFMGKLNEVMDCGVELIGLDEAGDLEILCCALDTLEALKLQDYTLELSNVQFFEKAAALAFEDKDDQDHCARLVDAKSMVELEAFLKEKNLDPVMQQFFLQLPWLNGDIRILSMAKELSFDPSLVEVLEELEGLWNTLQSLGYRNVITFDLGKLSHLHYYTGLIFEGFTSGVGTSILSGGRYDTLLQKFGLPANARGFSVKLDYVMDVIDPAFIKQKVRIYYPDSRMQEAFKRATELRGQAAVEMVCWDSEDLVEENLI